MDLKLARTDLKQDCKIQSLADILKVANEHKRGKIFYLDKDNSDKDLKKAISTLTSKGKTCFLREIKYGLDEKDYIYELHLL
ncbi:HP0268 family nuclease [Helicobacter sp. 11S02629-2]|uniref:HP0268 family nuclease n=1 Tax=Helicobacter sp. 11S02629-2 TaxID=1476195 RepID=UPI000BA6556E|nr:HP0268 family nuclease [Helicobacter sp. 11S02629-2]PAF45637.1 hypothetical protein BKH40_01785 [Helicobacter sp. 11S02629-2]